MPSLPFARINLRRNPFGEPSAEERVALFVGELEDWSSFLRAGRVGEGRGQPRCFQLLGPSGCGKTMSLLALRERFHESDLVAWCPVLGWPVIPEPKAEPLFVDDAQMASGALLGKLFRFQTVAVATQEDLAVPFHDAGFRVHTVPVRDRVDLPWLQEMARRRLEWARRGPGPLPGVEEGVLQGLFERHAPDIVAIQADLYDRYQHLGGEA